MKKDYRTPDDGNESGDDAVYQRQGAITITLDGREVKTIVKGDKGDLVVFDDKNLSMFEFPIPKKVVIAVKIGSLIKHIYLEGNFYNIKVTRWA